MDMNELMCMLGRHEKYESLLQMTAKTQENLGEMLKIQKRQNEMDH